MEIGCDFGFAYASSRIISYVGDLLVARAAFAAFICAPSLGEFDSLTLSFPNEGALKFGDGTDELTLERCEWIVRLRAEREAFLDELNGHSPAGQLTDNIFEVDQ